MPDVQGTTCRSCGAKIFFAPTEKSASVPFDAAQTHIYGMSESGKMKHLGKGHVCHFATCPSREQHRKPETAKTTVTAVAAAAQAQMEGERAAQTEPAPAPQPPPQTGTVDRTPPKGRKAQPPARDYREKNPPIDSVFPEGF